MLSSEKTTNKFDKFCFWAIIIDIFFLPYFSQISVSFSIIIIAFWYLLYGKKTYNCWEHKYFIFIIFIMIISTLINPLYTGKTLYETTLLTSIKRLLQFITSMWYYFFFRYYIKTYKISLNKIVFWAIIYIFLFSLFYFFNTETYATIKSIIHPADNHTNRWLSHLILEYRFNFLWTDPNNVAYMSIALLSYYILETKNELYKKYLLYFLTSFILFCTMSNGGLIIFALVTTLFFISSWPKKRISKKSIKIGFSIIILIILLALLFKDTLISFANSNLINMFLNRFKFYLDNDNISGGRLADLIRSFTMFNPMFIFIGSGKEGFTTENGHIYLICMYGLITYIYFMAVLFGKKKNIKLQKYISLIPLFVGFTLNIAIIEQKYLLILLLISAYYSANNYNKLYSTNEGDKHERNSIL